MCIEELAHTVGKVFPFASFYNPYGYFKVKVSVHWFTFNTFAILANLSNRKKNSKPQAQSLIDYRFQLDLNHVVSFIVFLFYLWQVVMVSLTVSAWHYSGCV